MTEPLRVGNASGFYGDRFAAMQEMLEGGDLDVLTGDYLAELTMLILFRSQLPIRTGRATAGTVSAVPRLAAVKKAAYTMFRWLPRPVRRMIVHIGAPSFTVGAVAVLRRPDSRVVFVDQRHTDGWALPGGLLRRGEAAAEALVREVCE